MGAAEPNKNMERARTDEKTIGEGKNGEEAEKSIEGFGEGTKGVGAQREVRSKCGFKEKALRRGIERPLFTGRSI